MSAMPPKADVQAEYAERLLLAQSGRLVLRLQPVPFALGQLSPQVVRRLFYSAAAATSSTCIWWIA